MSGTVCPKPTQCRSTPLKLACGVKQAMALGVVALPVWALHLDPVSARSAGIASGRAKCSRSQYFAIDRSTLAGPFAAHALITAIPVARLSVEVGTAFRCPSAKVLWEPLMMPGPRDGEAQAYLVPRKSYLRQPARACRTALFGCIIAVDGQCHRQ